MENLYTDRGCVWPRFATLTAFADSNNETVYEMSGTCDVLAGDLIQRQYRTAKIAQIVIAFLLFSLMSVQTARKFWITYQDLKLKKLLTDFGSQNFGRMWMYSFIKTIQAFDPADAKYVYGFIGSNVLEFLALFLINSLAWSIALYWLDTLASLSLGAKIWTYKAHVFVQVKCFIVLLVASISTEDVTFDAVQLFLVGSEVLSMVIVNVSCGSYVIRTSMVLAPRVQKSGSASASASGGKTQTIIKLLIIVFGASFVGLVYVLIAFGNGAMILWENFKISEIVPLGLEDISLSFYFTIMARFGVAMALLTLFLITFRKLQ